MEPEHSPHVVHSVPGPTVDQRVSVNSGAERMGATTQCHDKCVLTNKERSSVSCRDATACLGEWTSGVVHASTTITNYVEAFRLLNRLEQDSHLVVDTHKAPHEVQRQCLLHVPFKMIKVVLSHVRKVKACVPNFSQTTISRQYRVLRHSNANKLLNSRKPCPGTGKVSKTTFHQFKTCRLMGSAKTLSKTNPQLSSEAVAL